MGVQCRLLLGHQVALPDIRQIVWQFFRLQPRQVGQHAAEVKLHIQIVALGAGNQRPQDRVVLGGFVVPREQPISTTDGHASQSAFGHVVVYAQARIGRVDDSAPAIGSACSPWPGR